MDLSISIVNYNTKNLIKQCVKNILQSCIQINYEIIITDNHSSDGSAEFIAKEILPHFPNVKLICAAKNLGFGAGHNLGLKNAASNYLMITNPDIIVLNNAIFSMYEFMERHKNIGIAGPKLLYPDLTLQKSAHRWPSFYTPLYRRTSIGKTRFGQKKIKHYDMTDVNLNIPQKVDWLFGACLFIRKTVWDIIEGFDERFFLYVEDVDICRKCWNVGFEVWYYGKARMIHYHKRMSAKKLWWKAIFNKTSRIHLKSHLKYFRKWQLANAKYKNFKS